MLNVNTFEWPSKLAKKRVIFLAMTHWPQSILTAYNKSKQKVYRQALIFYGSMVHDSHQTYCRIKISLEISLCYSNCQRNICQHGRPEYGHSRNMPISYYASCTIVTSLIFCHEEMGAAYLYLHVFTCSLGRDKIFRRYLVVNRFIVRIIIIIYWSKAPAVEA